MGVHDFVEKGHECTLKGDADLERRGNDIPGLVTLWFRVLSFFNPVRYCSPSPAALLEKEGICFLRAQPPHLPGASPPRWQGDHSCPVHGTVPRPVCDGIHPRASFTVPTSNAIITGSHWLSPSYLEASPRSLFPLSCGLWWKGNQVPRSR